MKASFDKFNRFEKPAFYLCNPGCVYRDDGSLSNALGALTGTSDEELVMNFNTTSELDFRIYDKRKRYADNGEENFQAELYDGLKNRRMIFLDDIGFFMISEVKEGTNKNGTYKDVYAESCETEIQKENIPYIENGSYQIGELLNILMEKCPLWSVAEIDGSIEDVSRYFEDVDVGMNILAFMLDNMQNAYECIFIFDILHRTISVHAQDNYVDLTNIHITNQDFINDLSVDESSDDLYTALSVFGADELSINAVNPLGTSVIYNFDYYLDWMSPSLKDKVTRWQALMSSSAASYYSKNMELYGMLTTEYDYDAELSMLNTRLSMYRRCRDNIVAEANTTDIVAYNNVILQVYEDRVWSSGIDMHDGDLYIYNGVLYKCIYDHTSDENTKPGSGSAYWESASIPEQTSYTWVKFADDAAGSHMTSDPYGKNYIGLAYDKSTKVASIQAGDYEWRLFRDTGVIERVNGAETTYTFVVFADTSSPGSEDMSSDPDEKKYIGLSVGNSYRFRSEDPKDYGWELINKGNIGIPQTLARIADLIADTEARITDIERDKANAASTKSAKEAEIQEIRSAVSMENNFTTEEMAELNCYIFEGRYTDEYITVTESMGYSQRFRQMKELYDRGVKKLSDVSTPSQEISVDSENFIFSKSFSEWTEKLQTGCVVNIELKENDVAQLFLSSISVNYDDRKLKMKFGNRYNRFDPKALYQDALGSIQKTANTLSYIRDAVLPIRNGQFNAMREALNTSRTLTKNSVLASNNQSVLIDDKGYTGAELNADGVSTGHEIKINGRNIVFTDDEWETCRTAIGELILGNGESKYGINAELLMGDIIVGNQLHIFDNEGREIFDISDDRIHAAFGNGSITEYYLSDLDAKPVGGSWSEDMPTWTDGKYLWTRKKYIWSGSEDSVYSEPVYDKEWSSLSASINAARTDITLNQNGIRQNTEYYTRLNNQLEKINAYIQTGVLNVDDEGKTSYGVKIGETLASVDAYIVGVTPYTSDWLSDAIGGDALTPVDTVIYTIKTGGSHYGKSYRWTGSAYEETGSDGTLSAIFTSSELGFYDTGEKTAYFSNKNLNVKTVRTEKILLSTDVVSGTDANNWQIGTDNGFYLKWVGGTV